MTNEIIILTGTAATLGFVHVLFGPDHYLPFIVLARIRKWSIIKTAIITFLCGAGHILSSVILGLIGIAFGIALFKLEVIESLRGEAAAWLLIIFGFVYSLWGLLKKNLPLQPHSHSKSDTLTPWILFIIFVFGPCEILIPIVMYPAASHNIIAVAIISSIFGFTAILTMLGIVLASCYGLLKLPFHRFKRFSHALAGFIIFLCGVAIKFWG